MILDALIEEAIEIRHKLSEPAFIELVCLCHEPCREFRYFYDNDPEVHLAVSQLYALLRAKIKFPPKEPK